MSDMASSTSAFSSALRAAVAVRRAAAVVGGDAAVGAPCRLCVPVEGPDLVAGAEHAELLRQPRALAITSSRVGP